MMSTWRGQRIIFGPLERVFQRMQPMQRDSMPRDTGRLLMTLVKHLDTAIPEANIPGLSININ